MKEPALEAETRTPFTCCLDCGGRCELVAVRRGMELVRIDTPTGQLDTVMLPRLVPCARGRAHRRLLSVSERVLHPMRRTDPRRTGEFEEINWATALDLIAERLTGAREEYGCEAVLCATGAGAAGSLGISGAAAARRFFSFWGPVTGLVGNMSSHAVGLAADWMYGGRVDGSDRATILDSRLIVLWGMNPAETRMGPNTEFFIAEARNRGAKVILLEARYTDSGVLADQWIPVRPGTDVALAAAVAFTLEEQDLVDRVFLDRSTTGYGEYRDYILGSADGVAKTPEWAECITGVPAAVTRGFARELGTRKPAMILPGWGPQRALHGEQFPRAMITLACMIGSVGLRGGGAASLGFRQGMAFSIPGMPSGSNDLGRTLHNATWATDLLSGDLQPPVKVEADLVLPIALSLERWELMRSWGHNAHVFLSPPVSEPAGEVRTDYWVFAQLAQRLGFHDAYTLGRTEEDWIRYMAARTGPAAAALARDGVARLEGSPRSALAEFRANPAANPLPTPSGCIELANAAARSFELPHIASYVPLPPISRDHLHLLTPHSRLRANSVLHANPWLQRLERHALWINPVDACERRIRDGEMVLIQNENGTVSAPAKVTERIVPGVVSLYQGTWYEPDATGVDRGGCANTLTSRQLSPSGGMVAHSSAVTVRRAEP